MIRIVFGGDLYPNGQIESSFRKGDANEIFHDLIEDITSADLAIVNLESPLVSRNSPILKIGPVLGASVECIRGIEAAKWNVLNLANNHIFDHGASGIKETLLTIEREGLSFVGAGMNIKEAQQPLIRDIDGHRIIIYSMAEREFSIAGEKIPGANPFDLIHFVQAIQLHKQHGIFIVLLHGGHEFYSYPSPELIRKCRFMVDMGADVVICCHTHCPLPWEIYSDRPIVYGLGNLIFESDRNDLEGWHEGYLARLTIEDDQFFLETIPYFQSYKQLGANKMDKYALKNFTKKMCDKKRIIQDGASLERQWLQHCREKREMYLSVLFGHSRLICRLPKPILKRLHTKKNILNALHIVENEAHREILSTIFRDENQQV